MGVGQGSGADLEWGTHRKTMAWRGVWVPDVEPTSRLREPRRVS